MPRPGRNRPRCGRDGSVRLALQTVRDADIAACWPWASLPRAPSEPLPAEPDGAGGSLYHDLREQSVKAPGEAVWRVIEGIGEEHGWNAWPLAWAVRGCLDRAAGGARMRRGRRDPDHLRPGDALDFWRVEAIEPGHLLRLRAEMKLPGLAGIVTRRTCRADGLPAARLVPFTWPGRPPLLARVAATACHRLWRHGPQHHPGSQHTRALPLRAQIVLDSRHGCRGAPCAAAIARSAGLRGLLEVTGAGRDLCPYRSPRWPGQPGSGVGAEGE